MRPDGQRRYTFIAWRRKLALEESRALRALYRMHGRLPVCATTDWTAA